MCVCYDQDLVALGKLTLRPQHMDLSIVSSPLPVPAPSRFSRKPTSLLASLCGRLTLSASTDSAGESVEAYLGGYILVYIPGRIYRFSDLRRCQVSDQSNLENDDSFIIHIIICVSQHETNWSHLVMLVDVENLMI